MICQILNPVLIEFALVRVQYLKSIFARSGELVLDDFNTMIRCMCDSMYNLYYFPNLVTSESGRIVVYNEQSFTQLQKTHSLPVHETFHYSKNEVIQLMELGDDKGKTNGSKGSQVSAWERVDCRYLCNLGTGFCHVFHMCYHCGYGSRTTSYC